MMRTREQYESALYWYSIRMLDFEEGLILDLEEV